MSVLNGLIAWVRTRGETRVIPGRENDMVPNRAGGMTFRVDEWSRLRRFLILGNSGAHFYASPKAMALEGATAVVECLERDGARVVETIVEIARGNLAPRKNALLFALAMAMSFGAGGAGNSDVARRLLAAGPDRARIRIKAGMALPQVARTATDLYILAGHIKGMRGWGRSMQRAFEGWFIGMPPKKLALQAVKYRQREGWTLRDILRLAHPRADAGSDHAMLFDYIAHRDVDLQAHLARLDAAKPEIIGGKSVRLDERGVILTPVHQGRKDPDSIVALARRKFRLIDGYHRAKTAGSETEILEIVRETSIPWECIPSDYLKSASVWEYLLPGMGMTAMLRNLARMTTNGLLTETSDATQRVCAIMTDAEAIRRGGLHPFSILLALKTYARGRGFRGQSNWKPVPAIVESLNVAFRLAFTNVQPTGARRMMGIDISGSMDTPVLGVDGGPSPVSAREAAMALALVNAEREENVRAFGFTSNGGSNADWRDRNGLTPITFTRGEDLAALCQRTKQLPMGGTDASLLVRHATAHNLAVEVFEIYTDNESWAGPEQVTEALERYRQQTGIQAKLVSVAFSASNYSVADARDMLQMDMVGFDASGPEILSHFIRGNL